MLSGRGLLRLIGLTLLFVVVDIFVTSCSTFHDFALMWQKQAGNERAAILGFSICVKSLRVFEFVRYQSIVIISPKRSEGFLFEGVRL